jgi:hypothetical protein
MNQSRIRMDERGGTLLRSVMRMALPNSRPNCVHLFQHRGETISAIRTARLLEFTSVLLQEWIRG